MNSHLHVAVHVARACACRVHINRVLATHDRAPSVARQYSAWRACRSPTMAAAATIEDGLPHPKEHHHVFPIIVSFSHELTVSNIAVVLTNMGYLIDLI